MTALRAIIESRCDIIGPAWPISRYPETETALPDSYWGIVAVANGFVTHQGFFRFFGTRALDRLPAVDEWNRSPWRTEYGYLVSPFVLIAEDIFGDQYGFDRSNDNSLCKIHCEGGNIDVLETENLETFLRNDVLVKRPTAYDHDLAIAAFNAGVRPGLDEHMSFELPLICGGEYALSNLTIESNALHLGLLGQITLRNQSIPNGTAIARFQP